MGYWPALNGGFIWDDNDWIITRMGLLDSFTGVKSMWLHPSVLPQYYPLTATSFALDYQLWGTWTLPYHLENVLLHFLAAMLLWELLVRLRIPGAWLASAIFAVHPVMVESVAWITERKNVLSIVFFLGALLLYEQYSKVTAEPTSQESGQDAKANNPHPAALYALVFFLFFAALLAKTSVFPLPAVILLMVWWKTGRVRWRENVVPILRLFALALALCAITFFVERNNVGAKGADFMMTPGERILVAGHAFWFYLGKLFWPANLCFVYTRWHLDTRSGWQWVYPLTALGVSIMLWTLRSRIGRGPATAVFYYVGTLFPVLGFLNVFAMRYSYVWDHWVYLSAIGIIVLVAALVTRLAERLGRPALVYVFAALVLPLLTCLTWWHAADFESAGTIWEKTLALDPNCALAHCNLGAMYSLAGNANEAIMHYRRAIELKPNYYEALYDYGVSLANQGRYDEAIEYYRRALAAYPTFPAALTSLGYALTQEKKYDEAIKDYRGALRLDPNFINAHCNLGLALFEKGDFPEAIQQLRDAADLNPDCAAGLNNLLEILDMNNQAWILATSPDPSMRNGARAVELAKQACDLTHFEQPFMVGTLAAAYAEAGRFDEAMQMGEKACQIGSALGDTNLVQRNRELMRLYQAHQAYHEKALRNSNNE